MTSSVAVASTLSDPGKYGRSPRLHDSGVGSFGSESDTSPIGVQSTMAPVVGHARSADYDNDQALSSLSSVPSDSFTVYYLGEYILDRRYTQPMLPWVMAEVRRRGRCQMVNLVVEQALLRARSLNLNQVLFEHKLQTMTRFAKTLRDVRCFSYLTRPNVDAAFTCHVYQAEDEGTVQLLFDSIRKASLSAVRSQSQSGDDMVPLPAASQSFEVLYVGKVVVSTKKAPPTFIDDAVLKFDEYAKIQHDEEEEQRMRHESDTSIQSLPTNVEKTVTIGENELLEQTSKEHGSSVEETMSSGSEDAFAESSDTVPSLGVSSSSGSSGSCNSGLSSALDARSLDPVASVEGDRVNRQRTISSGSEDSSEVARRSRDGTESLQKQVLQSHGSKIRTMLIQIGQSELSLFSLDRKSMIFERQFKDISFCSQGITHPEHFGFISRAPESGNFTCYVFRCASESVVEEVMLTLKRAFQSAFEQSGKSLVICELCPMHQLHKLCQDIDRLSTEQMHITLQQRIGQLSDHDQNKIMSQIERRGLQSSLGTVEVIMTTLLKLSEEKQQTHVHINDVVHRQDKNDFVLTADARNKPSKFESFRNLARKSITNSLEHFLGVLESCLIYSLLQKEGEAIACLSYVCIKRNLQRFGHCHILIRVPTQVERLKKVACRWTAVLTYTSQLNNPWDHAFEDCRHSQVPKEELFSRKVDQESTRKILSQSEDSQGSSASKPMIVEDLFSNDLGSSRIQAEVQLRDARQRRHSTPHNVAVVTSAGGASRSPKLRSGFSRSNQPETDTLGGRNYIPSDSPIRSMFVKVGNNVDARRRRTGLTVPSSGAFRSYSTVSVPPALLQRQSRSWRLSILSRVVSSSQSDSVDFTDGDLEAISHSKNLALAAKERMKELWRKAIFDTILLLRMDKENKLIEEAQKSERVDVRESKLDYEEITPCLKEVTKVWEQMLDCENRSTTKFSRELLTKAVKDGIPQMKRGEIWLLLVEQHWLHHRNSARENYIEPFPVQYSDLLKQLTIHQHAILIDLGRTFPGHPYFSAPLGQGQLSLFNLLKAYSLLDQEVGYCQGLSFVTGILLMHMPEEKAFDILKYMMFNLGFRRQYLPDMVPLQIQMYQLSRLLHDLHRDLYDHFEMYEIAPTLYAAPWFLTIFASQFPLGFVGRVFDLVFLQGTSIVLKVGLVLLGNHKELIKQCDSFESVVEFLKTTLPEMGIIQMERIINQVFATDISKQLEAYEVEYHVLQEEMTSLHTGSYDNVDASDRIARLQVANDGLRRQKMELLEQLQITRRQIHDLEDQNNLLLSGKHKLESQNQALELERKALLNAITKFRQFVPGEILSSEEFGVFASLNGRSTDADPERTDNCCYRTSAPVSEVTEDVSDVTIHPLSDGRPV